MNIALFSDCYTPIKNGVVTSMNQLRDGLAKKGHHVVIVTVKVPGFTDEGSGNILRVPSRPVGLGTEQQFGFVLQGNVNKFLKEHEVELIHTHSEFSLGQSGKYSARKLGIPLIHTTHTMWEDYRHYILNGALLSSRGARFVIRQLVKYSDVFIHPSVKAKNYFGDVCPGKPNRVIPNGVDKTLFQRGDVSIEERNRLRARYGLHPDDFVILFTGRIGKEKRVGSLLSAAIPLLKKYDRAKIMFVGQGPESGVLKKTANMHGIEKKVVLTGFIDWEQMYLYYAAADLFATASLSEVHPMTLIEAAISGLPAVVRNDESYMTLLGQGENGFLADTDEELTEKIELLINDPVLHARFSESSREISKIYSAESHVDGVERLYREVLESYPEIPALS